MERNKYAAYYRVSTQKQGKSGLGLEAQKKTVLDKIGCAPDAEFTEIESGKRTDRIVLLNALNWCKENKAVLVIAKLDRLARNVEFVFSLKNAGVEFICCDLPDMNTLTLGIFASYAQHEREIISERITKALAAKKARGEKLGTPKNLTQHARLVGYKKRGDLARLQSANITACKIASSLRKEGLSFGKIANKLNEYAIKTVKGNNFTACGVQKLLRLFEGV